MSLALLIFLGSFAYRYLTLQLTNDDYMYFAIGRQLAAFGEWPVVDLLERGDPLHKVMSGAVQAAFGYRLIGEVALDLTMLSGAAALTFVLAARVAQSRAIGLLMALILVVASPRLYDYAKAAIPICALWLAFGYLDRRTPRRLMMLGALTALAFLFRHDLGAFVGALSISAIVVAQVSSRSFRIADFTSYAVPVLAGVLPYLLIVQVHEGVLSYAQGGQRFVEREVTRSDDPPPAFAFDLSRPLWQQNPPIPVNIRWAPDVADETRIEVERQYTLRSGRPEDGRTWTYALGDTSTENLLAILADSRIEDTAHIDRTLSRERTSASLWQQVGRRLRAPPSFAIAPGILTRSNAVAWLYYLLHLAPYLAAILIVMMWIRGRDSAQWSRIVPAVVYCLVATPFLLRGNLYENARLADVMAPSVVVGAWVVSIALDPRRAGSSRRSVAWAARATAMAAVVVTLGSVAAFASLGRRLEQVPIFSGWGAFAAHARELTADLLASPPPAGWLSPESGARGAVDYLRACTGPDDRILVYGFYPELFFFSGRASATNPLMFHSGFWTFPDEQRTTASSILRHRVPIALIDATPVGGSSRDRVFASTYPTLHQHLLDTYKPIGIRNFDASTDVRFSVWVHKGWSAPLTHSQSSLPCTP